MANGKKKRIMFACGSGICTSTAVRKKVEAMLDENGFKGQYEITQFKISECPAQSVNYDFLVATTMAPNGLKCPYVNGIPYLIGRGTDVPNKAILELMAAE